MIISVSSIKGGVGKSTGVIFLSQALANLKPKSKILVIDLDPNNNLTDYYLRDEDTKLISSKSIAHYLEGTSKLKELIIPSPFDRISVIPTTPKLARVSLSVSYDSTLSQRFRKDLRELDYDYIFIDTPPALTLELTLGIYGADVVVSPIAPNRWIIQGYDEIEKLVNDNNKVLKGSKIKLYVLKSLVSEKKSQILDDLGIKTLNSFIPKLESIANANNSAKPLNEKTAIFFENAIKEII